MQFQEAFRRISKSRGYSQKAIADSVGVAQPSVASMLAKGNPTVNAMVKYLSAMGYEVALVPAGTRLSGECYVLETSRA